MNKFSIFSLFLSFFVLSFLLGCSSDNGKSDSENKIDEDSFYPDSEEIGNDKKNDTEPDEDAASNKCTEDKDCQAPLKCGAGGTKGVCGEATGNHLFTLSAGSKMDDHGNSIASDTEGNLYITGNFGGEISFGGEMLKAKGEYDAYIAKFDSGGKHIWSKSFGGEAEMTNMKSKAEATSIAVDEDGNIAISGFFRMDLNLGGEKFVSREMFNDIFIAKYDNSGEHLWSKVFSGERNDISQKIAFDSDGNIFFTGTSEIADIDFGEGSPEDGSEGAFFIVKLDKKGNPIWSKSFYGKGIGYGLATDAENSVVMTGSINGDFDFGNGTLRGGDGHIFIAKFESSGKTLWSRNFGSYTEIENGYTVAINSENEIVMSGGFKRALEVEGEEYISEGDNSCYLIKFKSTGEIKWSRMFDGKSSSCQGQAVTFDGADNIILTGKIDGTIDFGGGEISSVGEVGVQEVADIFAVKLGPEGDFYWNRVFGGLDEFAGDLPQSVTASKNGEIALIGQYDGENQEMGEKPMTTKGSRDIFLIKLAP